MAHPPTPPRLHRTGDAGEGKGRVVERLLGFCVTSRVMCDILLSESDPGLDPAVGFLRGAKAPLTFGLSRDHPFVGPGSGAVV